MLLPSYGKQGVMDVDALLDESIEVDVGLCPVTCVTSPSNDGVITLNSSIISDVRSDSKVTEDVIANDKRDDDDEVQGIDDHDCVIETAQVEAVQAGVIVMEVKEEGSIVTKGKEDGGVTNEVVDYKCTTIVPQEGLEYIIGVNNAVNKVIEYKCANMAEESLDFAIAVNNECMKQYSDEVSECILDPNYVLDENEECLMHANNGVISTVKYLQTTFGECSQQLTELATTFDRLAQMKDDIATKQIIIDEMSNKIKSLEEKAVEDGDLTDKLRIALAKIIVLEDEKQSLAVTNEENSRIIAELGSDVVAKETALDEMKDDVKHKAASLKVRSERITDLTKQIDSFKAENKELKSELEASITNNKDNVRLMTVLVDELGTKQTSIDEMSENIQQMNKSLEEKSAGILDFTKQLRITKSKIDKLEKENSDLAESLSIANAEIDVFKTKTEDLTANSMVKDKKIHTLECDVESKRILVKELTHDLRQTSQMMDEKSAEIVYLKEQLDISTITNDNLVKVNKAREEKIAESMNAIECMSRTMKEEKARHEGEIEEMKEKLGHEKNEKAAAALTLQAKQAENDVLIGRLQFAKAESDKIKVKVETLVAASKESVDQITMLEEDVAAKKNTIDSMSADIKRLNTTCEKITAESDTLKQEMELIKSESNSLKSSNKLYSIEVEKYTLSLKEVNASNEELQLQVKDLLSSNDKFDKIIKDNKEKNSALQLAVESMVMTLDDERANHDKQIEGMKHVMENLVQLSEESLGEVNSKVLTQKKTIASLTKSLEEAMVEIRTKDNLLEKYGANNNNTEQSDVSDCGVGFWRS
jgi:chromosome segregation ATPase